MTITTRQLEQWDADIAYWQGAHKEMTKRKDEAYTERNKVVALLARLLPAIRTTTAIKGWSKEWHNCVYIETPMGQLSWHYHDDDAHLFERVNRVPSYIWDGHSTEIKYERIRQFCQMIDNHRAREFSLPYPRSEI